MPDNERGFNRGRWQRCVVGKRIERRVFTRQLAGRRVQLAQLDTAPKASQHQPIVSVRVPKEVRVDRVPIILLSGTDDWSFVHPAVAGTLWIERFVCYQADHGMVAAESRDRIVETIP